MAKSKVLIVEDDPFLLEGMTCILEQSKFNVKTATTTSKAFLVMKKFLPEVIVLDILLPEKDGFQFLSEIKTVSRLKNIPVLVASNLDQPKDRLTATRLGAVGYIVKNHISLQGLVKKISNLVAVSQ